MTRNFYTVSSESQYRAPPIRSCHKNGSNDIDSHVFISTFHTDIQFEEQSRENERSYGTNLRSVNYPRMPTSLVILSYSHCSYPLHGLALLRTGSMVLTGQKKRREMENKEREIPNKRERKMVVRERERWKTTEGKRKRERKWREGRRETRGRKIEGKTSLRHATNVIVPVVDERFTIKMRS